MSGGGFSNYFKQPSYQSEAVAGYLKIFGNEYSRFYNSSGRAYPDIAAYGVVRTNFARFSTSVALLTSAITRITQSLGTAS